MTETRKRISGRYPEDLEALARPIAWSGTVSQAERDEAERDVRDLLAEIREALVARDAGRLPLRPLHHPFHVVGELVERRCRVAMAIETRDGFAGDQVMERLTEHVAQPLRRIVRVAIRAHDLHAAVR